MTTRPAASKPLGRLPPATQEGPHRDTAAGRAGDGGRELQEVRLAVALTGGVSLAVWMGGVATEIQHLVRGRGAYGVLAGLTRTRVGVDVVGGSSAGGINGACLALALSHGTDMGALRDLWVEQGSLELLLRTGDDPEVSSLLRGDEYFLPHIRAALTSLCGTPNDPADNPVDLVVTGTLLHGRRQQCTDDFGSVFTDVVHRAQLRFRRGPAHPVDDFARPNIASRLALASRCTSSFPGAFEASWCPVGSAAAADQPDMADHADFPDSGWLIDGGVLVNKPLAPVLTTLATQPDEPGGRRVVLYVQPAPDDGAPVAAAARQVAPGFAAVLRSGLLGIPHAESLSQELNLVEEHNAAVAQQTRRRRQLLHAEPGWLRQASEQLLDAYTRVKADAAARAVTDHLPAGRRRTPTTLAAAARLRSEVTAACPPRLPGTAADLRGWPWSTFEVAEAERALATVLGLVADLPRHPAGDPDCVVASAREFLQGARRQLHQLQRQEALTAWRHGRDLLHAADTAEEPAPATDPAPGVSGEVRTGCAGLHTALAETLLGLAPTLREAAAVSDPGSGPDLLRAITAAGAPLGPDADPVSIRCWLLNLAVVLAGEQGSQRTSLTPWELLHVSAEAPNAFDGRAHPADKLAGLQLQHFGAFHKSSWRANDWLWGRLDAAARLVQLQLSPRRLAHLAATDPTFVDALAAAVCALATDAGLDRDPEREARIRREMAALAPLGPDEAPVSLPACTRTVLAAVQAQILREELPYVAERVVADEKRGHTPLPGGYALVAQVRRLCPESTGAQLAAAFSACRLGEERLADDARSQVYRRTVDRVADLAVQIGRPGGGHSRSAPLRWRLWSPSPLTRAVHRSAMQSRAVLLAVAALAGVGGVLLLSALSREVGALAASAAGCTCLAVAVILAGLRVGRAWWLIGGVACLSLVGGVVIAAAHTGPAGWRLWLVATVSAALAAAAHLELRARMLLAPWWGSVRGVVTRIRPMTRRRSRLDGPPPAPEG